MDLRVGETADVECVAGVGSGFEPVGVRFVGVRIVERDGLHDADVIVAVEGGQLDGVDAILEQAAVNREILGDVRKIGEVHFADVRTVKEDRNAVRLLVGGALQGDVHADGNARVGIGVGDGEPFIHGGGGDRVTEEVVVVFAIEQRAEIGGALLEDDGEREAVRLGETVGNRGERVDALADALAFDEPVDARAREGRVDARAVESDGLVGVERAGLRTKNLDGLLDAFGVELDVLHFGIGAETGGDELRFGHLVPALGLDRNLYGSIAVERNGPFARRGTGNEGTRSAQQVRHADRRLNDGMTELRQEQRLLGSAGVGCEGDVHGDRAMLHARAVEVHVFK